MRRSTVFAVAFFAVAFAALSASQVRGEAVLTKSGPFAHVSDEAWSARWRALARPVPLTSFQPTTVTLTQAQIDAAKTGSWTWQTQNGTALTPRVKNQAACGACAVFSILAVTEVQHARRTGQLVSLSEQSVLDCVQYTGLYGCRGANILDLGFALQSHDIALEMDYEYTSFDNQTGTTCKSIPKKRYISTLEQPARPATGNYEDAMAAYVRFYGPLQVSVDASGTTLRGYSSGVITSGQAGPSVPVNHGVVIMGYGDDDGTPYWLIKNSWGPQWGEGGYFRLERRLGLLGIAEQPVGVVLA